MIPTSLYIEIIQNVPIACVDVAIVYRGSVLLVLRKVSPAKNQWWLPGGRVHKNEMMKDAAKRKALEEVGLDCKVGPIIYTAETIFPDGPYHTSVHSINSCFLLYPIENPVVRMDNHHNDFKWVDFIPSICHLYVVKCLERVGLSID